jgi:hypothetical protein
VMALHWRRLPVNLKQAHPVTIEAQMWHEHPEVSPTTCRCPGGPCRRHPWTVDWDALLNVRSRNG